MIEGSRRGKGCVLDFSSTHEVRPPLERPRWHDAWDVDDHTEAKPLDRVARWRRRAGGYEASEAIGECSGCDAHSHLADAAQLLLELGESRLHQRVARVKQRGRRGEEHDGVGAERPQPPRAVGVQCPLASPAPRQEARAGPSGQCVLAGAGSVRCVSRRGQATGEAAEGVGQFTRSR